MRTAFKLCYPDQKMLLCVGVLCLTLAACGTREGPILEAADSLPPLISNTIEFPESPLIIADENSVLDPVPAGLRAQHGIVDAVSATAKLGMDLTQGGKYPVRVLFGLYSNLKNYAEVPAFVFQVSGADCMFSRPAGGNASDASVKCTGYVIVQDSDLDVLQTITISEKK